jgi:hypothetical protein
MMDFVRVLADYVDNDAVLNTLVSMELGNVYETPCGECRELADELSGNVPTATKDQRDRFAALVRARQAESIERLFERIASVDPQNIYASGLETYFRHAINQIFSALGWELRLDLVERFLRRQFEDDLRTHVFVSFNYDLALDRAVECAADGLWQPRNGYGVEFPFYTVGDPTSESPNDAAVARPCVELPKGSTRFRILKPHGSLNWLGPARRASVAAVEPTKMFLPLDADLKIRYWSNSKTFNYISRRDDLPRDVEILIAPPSPQKPPNHAASNLRGVRSNRSSG